jgi:hypothetical protein
MQECRNANNADNASKIRKYAEIHGKEDLQILFKEISVLTKKVREEIYRLLVVEFRYFE